MAKKKLNTRNYAKVLDNLKEFMKKENKESLKIFCEGLNSLLDEWAQDDAFGTEGQLDPRGDQRD